MPRGAVPGVGRRSRFRWAKLGLAFQGRPVLGMEREELLRRPPFEYRVPSVDRCMDRESPAQPLLN